MSNRDTNSKLAQMFQHVKPAINSQLPLFSDSVRHHSTVHRKWIRGTRDEVWRETRYYGVSSDYRILSKGLFIKRFDQVRDFLEYVLRLPTAEREVILRLLGYWSHYGICYPAVARLCQEPGCSKATAWRVIGKLKSYGMMHTVPRYLTPYRRQISDIFILHGLILLIAKYLAEHIAHIWPDWLMPALNTPWPELWSLLEGDHLKLPFPFAGARTAF